MYITAKFFCGMYRSSKLKLILFAELFVPDFLLSFVRFKVRSSSLTFFFLERDLPFLSLPSINEFRAVVI